MSKYSLTKDQLKNFERPVNTFFNSIINIDRKGANKLYRILNSNKVNICSDLVVKWNHTTELHFGTDDFKQAFIVNHGTNVNMYMRYIQYRILHYRIATKRELVKTKILDDEKCCFCSEVDTLEHLLYKCEKADSPWKNIQIWLNTIGFNNYILDAKTIILGELRKKNKLINLIIMAAELVICSNRNKRSQLILDQVKRVLKDLFHIENYWAETNDKLPIILGLWHPLYNKLINV